MTPTAAPPARDAHYQEMLRTLSEGSVHVHFDPYEDIDWDAPELQLDPDDPGWVLPAEHDPLGATAWYQALPAERQREIGRWRIANAVRVGAAFESVLIRGMMQYAVKLPNGSPEFRYCLHEMTEECNHIQMFQELVNRMGVDAPGMRPLLRLSSPFLGGVLAIWPVSLMIAILAGEEPIDHHQKALLREEGSVPPLVRRVMEIHIAEEARHISFAGEFLRHRLREIGPVRKALLSVVFPIVMRGACEEIATMPRPLTKQLGVPRKVHREAFWRSPASQQIMAGYFADMRALATETGLMTPLGKRVWKALGIYGEPSRYRGEPDRTARVLT
jgi:hypothetical protein